LITLAHTTPNEKLVEAKICVKFLQFDKKNVQENVAIYIVDKEMCWATPSPCLPKNINVKKINGYNFFYP
jgi:hypothetical protein